MKVFIYGRSETGTSNLVKEALFFASLNPRDSGLHVTRVSAITSCICNDATKLMACVFSASTVL